MGVVCVFSYPVADGKSGPQTVELLQKRLEMLGAVKTGNYSVDCETYQSQQSQLQRTVYLMHNSEHPVSCFSVLDTNTCLVTDNMFAQLMTKIKGFYMAKKSAKVEAKGQRYELEDFIIKVGSVVFGQTTTFKGVLVEIEFSPCVIPNDCFNIIKELGTSFMGNIISDMPPRLKNKVSEVFNPTDTIMQYLEHFKNFRNVAAVQQQQQIQPQR